MFASQQWLRSHVCARCFLGLDRQWKDDGVRTLMKNIDTMGTINQAFDWQNDWWSTQWRSARMPANIKEVEGVALCQEDKSHIQFTTDSCATDWHFPILGFLPEHSLKILYKSKHLMQRYGGKRKLSFFLAQFVLQHESTSASVSRVL